MFWALLFKTYKEFNESPLWERILGLELLFYSLVYPNDLLWLSNLETLRMILSLSFVNFKIESFFDLLFLDFRDFDPKNRREPWL